MRSIVSYKSYYHVFPGWF